MPTPPPQPEGCTPTSQAELKIETEYFETSTSKGTVITTATKTSTSSFPILGCEDVEATSSKDVCSAPTELPVRAAEWPAARATPVDEVEGQMIPEIEVPHVTPAIAALDTPDTLGVKEVPAKAANARASSVDRNRRRGDGDCEIVVEDLYVYPANPKDKDAVAQLRRKLDNLRDLFGDLESYTEIKSDTLGFTAFFYVYNADLKAVMKEMDDLGNGVVSRICTLACSIVLHELIVIHATRSGVTPLRRTRSTNPKLRARHVAASARARYRTATTAQRTGACLNAPATTAQRTSSNTPATTTQRTSSNVP